MSIFRGIYFTLRMIPPPCSGRVGYESRCSTRVACLRSEHLGTSRASHGSLNKYRFWPVTIVQLRVKDISCFLRFPYTGCPRLDGELEFRSETRIEKLPGISSPTFLWSLQKTEFSNSTKCGEQHKIFRFQEARFSWWTIDSSQWIASMDRSNLPAE